MNQIKIDNLKPIYSGTKYVDFKDMINGIAEKYASDDAFILKHKVGKEVEYEHISFEQFKNDIYAFGAAMCEKSLVGKRIAIIGNNSYDWFMTYMSVLGGIGVAIPLDKGLPYDEVESSLIRSYADVLIFDSAHKETVEKIKANGKTQVEEFIAMRNVNCAEGCPECYSMQSMMTEGTALIANGDTRYDDLPIDPNANTILLFTSGTSALSKAVMLSQENILSNLYAMQLTEDIRRGDVNMAFLPYHHTFGSVGQLVMLVQGATTTFCDGLKYIQKNMVEYGVSVFVCVPLLIESIYKKVVATIEKEGKTKKVQTGIKLCSFLLKFGIDVRRKVFKEVIDKLGGNLRFVISGAAAIDPETLRGLENFGIKAVQGYGMTEASPVLAAENTEESCPGSIGKALPGIELRIDEPNEEGIGELIARGPNVMSGYFENEEETAKTLVDGWLHTGDLAKINKDGYIFICGRKKNVIVLRNGKNVYPEELEVLLANLPYVEESMVFGEEKHAGSGDHDLALAAKIVYKPDVMLETYGVQNPEQAFEVVRRDIDALNDTLPVYKKILRLVVTDEPMIKTTTGKVKRYEEQKAL